MGEPKVDSTSDLLQRVRHGDRRALDVLIARYLPRLRRWAHGRLPPWARDLADTSDIVQETVIQTFKHLERFEDRGEGALEAYLRRALINRMRNEIRRVTRRPAASGIDPQTVDPGTSPLEAAIGVEALARYERALSELRPEDQEAIVGRIELGCTSAQLAELLDKPSPNAARMAVERALVRLAKKMQALETPSRRG